jgi:hypothetical protein
MTDTDNDDFDAEMAKLRDLAGRIFTEADIEQLRAIAETLTPEP